MKVLFIFLLFVLSINLVAQEQYSFHRLSQNKFTDGHKEADLHKFRHVFRNDAQRYKLFKKFNRTRVTQITLNSIYGTAIGLGIALAVYDANSCDNNTYCGFGALAAIAFDLVILLIAGGTNAIINPIKNKRKRKLLQSTSIFDTGLRQTEDDFRLNLKLSQNGMGVVLSF